MKLMNKDEFIAKEIKYDLFASQAKEGMKLPSERKLAEKYNVQRMTVRLALQRLERESIIEVRQRSGYYVRPKRIDIDLREIMSLSEKAKNIGKDIENKLLSLEIVETDKKLSKIIKLPIGRKMFKIARVRYILDDLERIPVSLDEAYIPMDLAPELMDYDLEHCSLFEILKKQYGTVPFKDLQRVSIVNANEREADILNVSRLAPLVKKKSMTYDKNGELIQYLYSIKNKDWTSFKQINPIINGKIGGFID
ncbi:GntR family transcriptional regulator [Lacrimispora saccharolytica]|uniref:Transcriptional regulator, GntR family n=1 Tax=Lacrimispora saccharolytica (strain ATCC 35040 / DSM 2544 / NRCC 2533 / WM1) TaxID=610130 RepID=D9R9M3_LACSW|nr:GntR family transcriptional regulator [Lacrimispora saccharolytica]ADL04073.1 transcriptional regulator, GntR family [[Clostridium] saccharolyticum WM1]QRV21631.1 GntR family transcriptional regulator [Lacrimispora saccharolytica]